MCGKNFWKRIIPFVVALAIGLLAANVLHKKNIEDKTLKQSRLRDNYFIIQRDKDDDWSGCEMNEILEKRESVTSIIDVNSDRLLLAGDYHLKVISEIPAKYTEVARRNRTQGKVVLHVDFLANGKIGKISIVESLPHSLTEQAISATKKIKFQPAGHCWGLNNETATVTYTFSLN